RLPCGKTSRSHSLFQHSPLIFRNDCVTLPTFAVNIGIRALNYEARPLLVKMSTLLGGQAAVSE
ncbi:MAG: hypothetical protein V7708_18405, partial [Oceanicoccus sp.]